MRADWPRPIVHFEIQASDPQRLREFYSTLFHWDIADGAIMSFDAGVGGPEPGPAGHIREGERGRLTLYVQVRDLRETLDKAEYLGGTITAEPFQFPNTPTLATITDPEGNPVMLVQQ